MAHILQLRHGEARETVVRRHEATRTTVRTPQISNMTEQQLKDRLVAQSQLKNKRCVGYLMRLSARAHSVPYISCAENDSSKRVTGDSVLQVQLSHAYRAKEAMLT